MNFAILEGGSSVKPCTRGQVAENSTRLVGPWGVC